MEEIKNIIIIIINIIVPGLEDEDWTHIHRYSEHYLADIPRECINIEPNDTGSGNGTVSSSSSTLMSDEEGEREFEVQFRLNFVENDRDDRFLM